MTGYATPPGPPTLERPARTGIRLTTVPGVLLGLGALCLLVAAVIFLAVAWSWLGVGGRTGVLVCLTVVAGGAGLIAARGNLRAAGETLTLVALGLVALDVLGAYFADWWGPLDVAELALLLGSTVTIAAVALAAAPYRLITPQLVAGPAALMAYAGALGSVGSERLVDITTVVVLAGMAWTGVRTGREPLAAMLGTFAAFPWLHLTLDALAGALAEPALRDVWAGPGPMLVIAAALMLLVPVTLGARDPALITLLGGASATLVTLAVGVPTVDEGTTTVATASLVALLAWTAVALGLGTREPWRRLPLIPSTAAAVPLVATVLTLSMQAVIAVLSTGPVFSRAADAPLGPVDPVAEPWLLLVGVGALAASAWVAVRPVGTAWSTMVYASIALGGVATLALLDVPLAVPLAALVAIAAVLVGSGARAIGCGLLVVAAVAALPSALLTGLVAAVTAAAAAWCLRSNSTESRLLGGLLTPPALAVAIWAFAEVVGVEEAVRGYPVLLAVGLLALVLPRPEVEASAWITALVAVPAAVNADLDPMTATAMHLTLAGVLVAGSALVNPQRQELGWVGGLLLAAATWVRLADLGVEAPEAYTLPSALALIAVGLVRLARDPGTATTTALTPGLVLASVPSLLWCLDDPISWRAVWLGAACFALVLIGVAARWNAPILVGGTVGGLLVLRELAPYAAETPQWILIGVAGALLTVFGVTWERRLVEMRRAAAYLERLR